MDARKRAFAVAGVPRAGTSGENRRGALSSVGACFPIDNRTKAGKAEHGPASTPYCLERPDPCFTHALRLSGTLPPLSASFVMTCFCSQTFIAAEPSSAPV